MAARPATRLLEGLAPWIPIAMLVALVGIAFYLRAQELGCAYQKPHTHGLRD